MESDGEEEIERILKWTVIKRWRKYKQVCCVFENCTPWVLKHELPLHNFQNLKHQRTLTKLNQAIVYAPVSFSKNSRLDVKMLNEDTDWGVVHCKFKKEFFGINAPIDAFRDTNSRSVAVTFRRHEIPLYGMILHSTLGEHSNMFHHLDISLYPAATIRNNLAQKITLVMQDSTINEPTSMRTILPGEEFYPKLLRRDMDTVKKTTRFWEIGIPCASIFRQRTLSS